jgi:sugar fermentation stimulation protein A
MQPPVSRGGVYQLYLRLRTRVRIQIGRLGAFEFPVGSYVYTGSALNGLERRIARHRRREKRLHWHIDYLLAHAEIERVLVFPTRERLECELNQRTMTEGGGQVVVPGFGSSDCRCKTHLLRITSPSGSGPRSA